MTVLVPWPPLRAGHWLPSVPVQPSATSLPPCEAASRGDVGRLAMDLSALSRVRPALRRQALGLQAGMAELVLLNRLRARTRRELSKSILERAARVIEVTASSWLSLEPAPASAA